MNPKKLRLHVDKPFHYCKQIAIYLDPELRTELIFEAERVGLNLHQLVNIWLNNRVESYKRKRTSSNTAKDTHYNAPNQNS